MEESRPPPALNEQIGPYRLDSVLGEGGMGRVYAATDIRLQRPVALKVLKESLLGTPQMRRRFIREAQANAAIRHDNVVTLYDVGEQDGRLFLATELLQGATLDQLLDAGRQFAPRQAALLAMGVLRGLDAAHAAGVVHRDIKPANIWIEAGRERPKLLDFGLALRTGPVDPLGRPGAVAGTPHYLSPEQAQDLSIDARSDLYQWGVVLFRLLSGRLPFVDDDLPRLLMAIIGDPPPSLASVAPQTPASLCQIVDQQLRKRPWERVQSAAALHERLQANLPQLPDDPQAAYRKPIVIRTDGDSKATSEPPSGESGEEPAKAVQPAKLSSALLIAFASLGIALCGAGAMWLLNRPRADTQVSISSNTASVSAPSQDAERNAALRHLELVDAKSDQSQVPRGEPILIDFHLRNRAPTERSDPRPLFSGQRNACQVVALIRDLNAGSMKPADAFPLGFSGTQLPGRGKTVNRQFRIESADLKAGRYEVVLQLQAVDGRVVMELAAPVELVE